MGRPKWHGRLAHVRGAFDRFKLTDPSALSRAEGYTKPQYSTGPFGHGKPAGRELHAVRVTLTRMRLRKWWKVVVPAAILAVVGLVWFFPPGFYRVGQEPQIQVALVRSLAGNRARATGTLEVAGGKPAGKVVQSLQALGVHMVSPEQIQSTGQGAFVDRRSGEPAFQCRIGAVRWRDVRTVEVEGSISWGLLSGKTATFMLTRSAGGWEVVSEAAVAVS